MSEQKQAWPAKYDINKLISIPEDINKLIKGNKTSVRRNDRYADPGDTLELQGYTFVVENVYPQKLKEVTEKDAKNEGYNSLAEYKDAITSIHEKAVWDPELEVWAHELKRK